MKKKFIHHNNVYDRKYIWLHACNFSFISNHSRECAFPLLFFKNHSVRKLSVSNEVKGRHFKNHKNII